MELSSDCVRDPAGVVCDPDSNRGQSDYLWVVFYRQPTGDNMARLHLGLRHVTDEAIEKWKFQRGYDKPLLINSEKDGLAVFTETIFFDKSIKLFVFDFGVSDNGRDIAFDVTQRMWPSLAIAVPSLVIALFLNISFALLLSFFRGSYIDVWGVVFCVMMMSISALFYYIGGQFLVGKILHLVPISGYETGIDATKFVLLPVIIGVIAGIGTSTRWYPHVLLRGDRQGFCQNR